MLFIISYIRHEKDCVLSYSAYQGKITLHYNRIIKDMVDGSDWIREQMLAQQHYIDLLEKVKSSRLGIGLNREERAALDRIDRQIAPWCQLWGMFLGIIAFAAGLGMVRLLARSPILLLGGIVSAAALGIGSVVFVFHRARQAIIEQEIRIAHLEIFRLEDRLNQ